MKFIARNLNLIGLLMLASFATAAAALYFQVPERIQTARAMPSAPIARYVCPMHASIFRFRDGSIEQGPAAVPQPAFEARIEGGKVEVRPKP